MKRKICSACINYTAEILAHNYDQSAEHHVCFDCPSQGLQCYARGYYIREPTRYNRDPTRTYWYRRHHGEEANLPL